MEDKVKKRGGEGGRRVKMGDVEDEGKGGKGDRESELKGD